MYHKEPEGVRSPRLPASKAHSSYNIGLSWVSTFSVALWLQSLLNKSASSRALEWDFLEGVLITLLWSELLVTLCRFCQNGVRHETFETSPYNEHPRQLDKSWFTRQGHWHRVGAKQDKLVILKIWLDSHQEKEVSTFNISESFLWHLEDTSNTKKLVWPETHEVEWIN